MNQLTVDPLRKVALDVLAALPIDRGLLAECLRSIEAALPPSSKPADILKVGWALFDKIVADSPIQPACRKGCAFCCTLPVQISQVEAEMLADKVRGDGERRRRLKENAKRARGLDDAAYTEALITCAFLDSGVCSVYDIRPTACRHWHSLAVDAARPVMGGPTPTSRCTASE